MSQNDSILVFHDESVEYDVKRIERSDCARFILNIHYAKRWPNVKYAFGLFEFGKLVGVCTYGTPPSHTLLKGVCGEEFAKDVTELNRLCLLNNKQNEASMLVGRSLKMLGNKIVVSYADSTQKHTGYVYQATNFFFTGQTKPMKEVYLKSRPELHHAAHKGKTFKQMEEEYGDDVGYRLRSIKNRYVIFVGDKRFKKQARRNLNYKVLPYPKGENNG